MIKRFLFEAFDCYVSLFYLAFVQVPQLSTSLYVCLYTIRYTAVLVVLAPHNRLGVLSPVRVSSLVLLSTRSSFKPFYCFAEALFPRLSPLSINSSN